MTQRDGRPTSDAANINDATAGFGNGNRRIDCLKQLAFDCNLTNDEARTFGDLRSTATWEKLLNSHGLEFEPKIKTSNNTVATASQESNHQINLMDWLECQQLIALGLAAVIFAVLFLSIFPNRSNPFKLFPQVKITIEFGDRK